MPILRHLRTLLELDAQDWNANIRAAQKEGREFEKTIRPMKEVIGDMGAAMSVAGLAVVGGMTAMAKAAANYGDEILDASKRTGESVESLSRLKFAAEQSGASFADVSTGLRVLANNMDAANTGGKAQARTFKDLGIAVTDSTGKLRPMNDVMLDVADRFQRMEDGAQKAALAQELFGRGGAALIPVLNEGREGIKALGDQAERLGLVIGEDAARAGDEFNDTLDQMRGAMMGLTNTVGQALLPALTDIAKTARDAIVAFKDWAREHEYLAKAIYGVALALTGTGGLLVGISGLLLVLPKVEVAFKTLAAVITPWRLLIIGVTAAVVAFRNEILSFVQHGLIYAIKPLEIFTSGLAEIGDKLGLPTTMLHAAADATKGLTERLEKSIRTVRVVGEEVKETAKETDKFTFSLDRAGNEIEELTAALARERQRLAGLKLAELLDGITLAQRTSNNEFAEWLKSVENGTAALIRLARELQNDVFKFDSFDGLKVSQDKLRGAVGDTTGVLKDQEIQVAKTNKTIKTETSEAAREYSRVWANALGEVTRDFARGITDVIFEGKKLGDAITGIAKNAAKNAMDAFLVGLFSPLTEQLGKLGSKLADSLGGLFGIGSSAAKSAVGGGASSAAGAIGGAGSGIAGAIGGAGSLTSGLIGAAGGIIGGGLAALATLRTEGTLNAIEYSTRASEIHLRTMIDQILWPVHNLVQFSANETHEQTMQLDAIYNLLASQRQAAVTVNNSPVYNVHVAGLVENLQALMRALEPFLVDDMRKNIAGITEAIQRILGSAGRPIASATA